MNAPLEIVNLDDLNLKIDWGAFHEANNEIFEAYLAKEYQKGLELSLALRKKFPALPSKTLFYVACFYSLLGEKEKALQALEEGVKTGGWWTSQYLDTEPDLEQIRNEAKYKDICKIGDSLFEKEIKKSVAQLGIRTKQRLDPDANIDVLLVLHWRGGNISETDYFWRRLISDNPNLVLAYLQSSQLMGKNMFCWDKWDTARDEVKAAYEYLKEKFNIDRFILAGVSQGATVAVRTAFNSVVPVSMAILVIPAIRDQAQLETLIESKNDLPLIPTLILCGKKDPLYLGAVSLDHYLGRNGAPVEFFSYEDIGHFYPPDFIAKTSHFLKNNVSL